VRQDVRELAADGGFADRASDVALALDEVVANAQEHGEPPITVTAWSDGRLVIEVSDAGGGFSYPEICRRHPPPQLGQRGRGLWIVRQLVDLVSIHSGADGTRVHMELVSEPMLGA
jgi:anti-sigma regulatory factor (Ser/Thr protein kinase)